MMDRHWATYHKLQWAIHNLLMGIKYAYTSTEIQTIETLSPEGACCDTVQVLSGAGDMQLI